MDLINLTDLFRFTAALVFVLALMGGLALIMRKVNHGAMRLDPRKRRLQIVETLPLDARRKALLLRRDGTEHLIILGPAGEIVVETGIESKKNGLDLEEKEE